MVSRITDDYARMADAGCVAITEPAFWAGFDRSAEGFADYFRQLTETEPRRAAMYGIQHHCWLCINAKEAEDTGLSREVIGLIPQYLDRPNVLGVGEIGLNKNSRNELAIFEEQLALAKRHDALVLIHTPHLEDKLKGTRLIVDALKNSGLAPHRVLIDHVEEHTVRIALDGGYWCAMTLYPETKCTPQRAVDILETHGVDRICMNSAGDWGPSDPLSVPLARREMRRRGHVDQLIQRVTFENPLAFLSQSPRFRVEPASV
ncbi:MAG: TatD family hydrolase [Phycisphaerales bacterium]|nr:TatD family hydrolase [Phycisphaerales bacterium]